MSNNKLKTIDENFKNFIKDLGDLDFLYEHKNNEIDKEIKETQEIFLLHSFVIQELSSDFSTKFGKEESGEVLKIFTSLSHIIRGVIGCFNEGSILGAYSLKRSFLERVLILGQIFSSTEYKKVNENIIHYKNFGTVLQYFNLKKYYEVFDDKKGIEIFNNLEKKFHKIQSEFKIKKSKEKFVKRNYSFESAIGLRSGNQNKISTLVKSLGINDGEDLIFKEQLYLSFSDLSQKSHGSSLDYNCFNSNRIIMPSHNLMKYRSIRIGLLIESIAAFQLLILYINPKSDLLDYFSYRLNKYK